MTLFGLSHSRASTQIVDAVHKTSEFNLFDRELIDSRYFQRLHFVLQNSTAYVSFPSNKNSRFPHSLGVAVIGGEIFSKALSNAAYDDLHSILTKMGEFLCELCEELRSKPAPRGAYKGRDKEDFDYHDEAHTRTISGLSHFLHSPIVNLSEARKDKGEELKQRDVVKVPEFERVRFSDRFGPNKEFSALFLADTYWQAIRLYGLMHDIGHLPMSHAFEAALDDQDQLFSALSTAKLGQRAKLHAPIDQINRQFQKVFEDRQDEFKGGEQTDGDYYVKFFAKLLDVPTDRIKQSTFEKAFHEIRGISIFNRFVGNYDIGFGDRINAYGELINYLCLSIIYSGALSPEESGSEIAHKYSFLYTLKTIIDGEVDADRLDYTLRDGIESALEIGFFDLRSITSNSVLISNRPSPDCEYAIGYYFRARSAIEQFYEQRYQCYKYIIYHRTCSRSNKSLEYLISLLINYSFLDPESDIAQVLESFGYITRANGNIDKILPDEPDDIVRVEDASLRTLLFGIKAAIKKDNKGQNDLTWRLRSEIGNLADIVLMRRLEHVFTLHKYSTITDVVKNALGDEVSGDDIKGFVFFLQSNHEKYTVKIRQKFIENTNPSDPISVVVDLVKPKVYNAKKNKNLPFERRLWMVGADGNFVPIEDESPSLKGMRFREAEETHFRIYVIARDVKDNEPKQGVIVQTFDNFIQDTWREFLEIDRTRTR